MAALFAAYPWAEAHGDVYPEVVSGLNFRVDMIHVSIPRVDRKKRGQPWALGRNAFGVECGKQTVAGRLPEPNLIRK